RGLEPKAAPAFDEWLDLERQRVSALHRDALRGRALELEAESSVVAALDLTRQLLDLDPLDESAYRAAMRLEYKRGHVQVVLRTFELCRRVLKEELDVAPLAETTDLAAAIGRGDGLLHPPVVPPRRRMPAQLLRPPVLVGREAEWARLESAWSARQAVNISGPPGIGKSRLMLDFARTKGSYFLLQGRPGDEVVPYSSMSRGMREALNTYPELTAEADSWVKAELSRILPDLFPAAPDVPRSDESESRLFEAIFSLLAQLGRKVDALLVDDLQFLDAKSFEVGIATQSRLLTGGDIFGDTRLIAVFRAGTLPAAFEESLALAVEFGIVAHVELGPLDAASVRTLLESLNVDDAAQLAPRLQRPTGGNPQFIVEALKRMHEVGRPEAGFAQRGELPDRLVALIKGRLDGLSAPAFRVAQALAVLAMGAEPELLAGVLEMGAFDVAEALDELEAAQVSDAQGFVHDLLREAVWSLTPEATRKLLHRRAALALEPAGANPALVAHHRAAARRARAVAAARNDLQRF
ncbi:MAG TPA: AAA family ATPase, partial [Trueperaceae bacterium]|nr:AAA family ATPase [Trueperaceae bacterium]